MPWHPFLVHIPIAFALFAPFFALYFAAYPAKRQAVWVLYNLLFAGFCYLAMATGISDQEALENKEAAATHRQIAEYFFYAVLVLLGLSFTGNQAEQRWLRLASAAWSFVVLGLCVAAAHQGGTLVHGVLK